LGNYNRPVEERGHSPGTRITYDDGCLEIMVVSLGHESPNRNLAHQIEVIAEETGKTYWPSGGTTFKGEDLKKGFEPDTSYYFEHETLVLGKTEVDLETDPARPRNRGGHHSLLA
jgi:Uma2 family endonuclease